jgi:hypothetical protein
MFLPWGNEDYGSGSQGNPLSIPQDRPLTRMDENLVFIVMGVFCRMAPLGDLEDAHAKMTGPIGPSDHHPAEGAFRQMARVLLGFNLTVMNDLHPLPFDMIVCPKPTMERMVWQSLRASSRSDLPRAFPWAQGSHREEMKNNFLVTQENFLLK